MAWWLRQEDDYTHSPLVGSNDAHMVKVRGILGGSPRISHLFCLRNEAQQRKTHLLAVFFFSRRVQCTLPTHFAIYCPSSFECINLQPEDIITSTLDTPPSKPMLERHDPDTSYPAATKSDQSIEASQTYATARQATGLDDSRYPICHTLAAWGLTATLNIIPKQFSKGSEDEDGWRTYPACKPETLRNQRHSFLLQDRPCSCEIFLLMIAATTVIHWSIVLRLFSRPRWRDKYLSQTLTTTFLTLLPLALLIRDPATVFLRILPTVMDVCASACLALDYFSR
ncbi:hypothetical protein J3F83DRAFT_133410 [Trichoderma novae-zelandiae]